MKKNNTQDLGSLQISRLSIQTVSVTHLGKPFWLPTLQSFISSFLMAFLLQLAPGLINFKRYGSPSNLKEWALISLGHVK